MKNKFFLTGLLSLTAAAAFANQQPTANENPAYGSTAIQPQLRFNIKDNTDTVHFVRDTNDPKILTKVYILKNADPYSIRPYLREMVQATRVDYNNGIGRSHTNYFNTYSKDSSSGEKLFVPTGVECIKFADGTGAVIVSAEDYRFKDHANGMGIDSLVAKLDLAKIANSSGQPKFIYFPKNRSAKDLQSIVKAVGANVSNDTTELIGGKDKVEVDSELNCLFFNTALYSKKNIEAMLKIYDIPHPEVRIRCTVYEVQSENDGMLGLDFQSWKNNDGLHLLQTGMSNTRNMNLQDALTAINRNGTVNTHYFNMEPKWNTKYLDFLVSKGKAAVVTTGDLSIQANTTGKLSRKNGTMIAELAPASNDGVGHEEESKHGNTVNVKPASGFHFNLEMTPSVTEKATALTVSVNADSMLGIDSNGKIRTSHYDSKQKVMLGNGTTRFYLGGIDKTEKVSVSGGIPLLKDLPFIGWAFSTERESTKKSRIIVVADCEVVQPDTAAPDMSTYQVEAGEFNTYGFRQFGLDSER